MTKPSNSGKVRSSDTKTSLLLWIICAANQLIFLVALVFESSLFQSRLVSASVLAMQVLSVAWALWIVAKRR